MTRLKAKRTRNRVLLAAGEGDFHLLKALASDLSPTKLPILLGSGTLSRSKWAGVSSWHLLLVPRSIINGAEPSLLNMPWWGVRCHPQTFALPPAKSGSSDSWPVQNIFDLQSLLKTPNCLSKYPVYEWTLSIAPNSEMIAVFRTADLFPISKGQLLRADTTK